MPSDENLKSQLFELERTIAHVRKATLELTGSMLSAYKVLNDTPGLTAEQQKELGALLDCSVKAISELGKALPKEEDDG